MNRKDSLNIIGISGLAGLFGRSSMAGKSDEKYKGEFGSCCKDLHDAMNIPPNSFFHVSDEGVLYQTVGYVNTEYGPGWFDQAVIYCPFSGHKLQDKAEIKTKANSGT
jgi:hypothetical protein